MQRWRVAMLVVVPLLFHAGAFADTYLQASFENASLGPWDPAGVEVGMPTLIGTGTATIDTGLQSSSRALHMQDVGIEFVRLSLDLDSAANATTSTSPYWLEYTLSVDPDLTASADAAVQVEGYDEAGNRLFQTWAGRWSGDDKFRYRIWFGPDPGDSTGSPSLSLLSASDEWRVVIELDPVANTQTHWLWENGDPVDHPIFGVPHPFINVQADDFQTLNLGTLGAGNATGDVDCTFDEIRLLSNPPPASTLAVPSGTGQIALQWADTTPDEDGFVIERRTESGEWTTLATGVPAGTTSYLDNAGIQPRERYLYRVASIHGSERSPWSDTAQALAVFQGMPLEGWLNVADYVTNPSNAATTTPQIQAALNDLGGRQDFNLSIGPHVLFFPDDTYHIDQTLYLEGRAGVQLIGESPGGVTILWEGSYGSSPDDETVMFHAEGVRDGTYRNLTWDGGCPGGTPNPYDCYVVAFDESFCGATGSPERNAECDSLPWPEDPDLGLADNGSAHFDSTFENAYIGLRIGAFQVQDSETTVRRCRFLDNFAGISIEDFNALDIWIWDGLFERNYTGVTNDVALARREFDPGYKPGTCSPSGDPCLFAGLDCPGETCSYVRDDWAGDFDVIRGRFVDNVGTDVYAQPTGRFTVMDSWSRGSGEFFFAYGITSTPGRYTLIRNEVETPTGNILRTASPGNFLLLDNKFYGDGVTPAVTASRFQPGPGDPPNYGEIDYLAVNNGWTASVIDAGDPDGVGGLVDADGPYDFNDPGYHLRSFEDYTLTPPPEGPAVVVPPQPTVVDPLANRNVYTLIDPSLAQEMIDAAAADPQPAVVHFPGTDGVTEILQTLQVPAGSDLMLTGDGGFSVLRWTGTPGQPLLRIDADQVDGVVVRDMQFQNAGMQVVNMNQPSSRLLLSRLRAATGMEAGYVFEDVDRVSVDLVDHSASTGPGSIGTLFKVGSTPLDPADQPGMAVWTGLATGTEWDFDVVNGDAGAKVLINAVYMENSAHHLRVRGDGAPGNVNVHSGKIATIVILDDPADNEELVDKSAAILVEDFPGNVSLVESTFFIQTPGLNGCCSSPEASEYGARVRFLGSETVRFQALGNTLAQTDPPDLPEYDVGEATGEEFLQLAGKRADPGAIPLPDVRVVSDVEQSIPDNDALTPSERQDLLDELAPGLELLRTMQVPGYYDEVGASATRQLNLDKVFFWSSPNLGLAVLGEGPTCVTDADCDDGDECNGTETCNVGTCLPGDGACPGNLECDEGFKVCSPPCFEDTDCNDGLACTNDFCLIEVQPNPPTIPGACRNISTCSDGIGCTADSCTVSGCVNAPDSGSCDDGRDCTLDVCDPVGGCDNPDNCPGGQVCDPGRDVCTLSCFNDPECDDGIQCTSEICLFEIGLPGTPGFCRYNVLNAGEVGTTLYADAITLQWSPPASAPGGPLIYDTLRSALPGDFSVQGVCLETDGSNHSTEVLEEPSGGSVYFYLVRAEYACAGSEGSLGRDSWNVERQAPGCP